jgi:uncharacterized sporulation protein YeaH/YhbH (DUF444 family)
MPTIIDRRLNPRDKTIKNRQKFVQRSKEQIKKAVKEAIDTGNLSDIENGKAKIKVKGIREPEFSINPSTGNKKYVMPGNDTFVVGDQQEKSKSGEGKGNGPKGGIGQGEDDFEFILNQEEFLNFIFEDLELPDLVKKQMKDVTKIQMKRAGFTNAGNPCQLDIVRSLKNSLGRRIGLSRPKDEDIEKLEEELHTATLEQAVQIKLQIAELKARQITVPWLDPFDVRYRAFTAQPQPMTKAVMFCIMDVSGSMGQTEKDLAKRFFFFLYMFLTRKYQKVEIIFIRHHETASEVDEDEFFNSRESGGTVVSTALELTKSIIDARYNVNDWNIYVSQASDGDNFSNDAAQTTSAMERLLPLVQYFAYVEIKSSEYMRTGISDLRQTYDELEKEYEHLHIRTARDVQDIWKVFKELFSKEKA